MVLPLPPAWSVDLLTPEGAYDRLSPYSIEEIAGVLVDVSPSHAVDILEYFTRTEMIQILEEIPEEAVFNILNNMNIVDLLDILDSLTIDIEALISSLSPEKAGIILNNIDIETASSIILNLSPDDFAIIEEMAKEDPNAAALRLEEAVKKIIAETDETTQTELLSMLTETLENVSVETLVNLFIEIANLPDTPSTVAYLLDNMNQTTVSLLLSAWVQLEEYQTLAKVMDYSSDIVIDTAYRDMTNPQRTNIIPHLTLETIIKLPKIGLFEVSNLLLNPIEVTPGMEVQVNFKVSNIGQITDVYQIQVIIDGVTEKTYFNTLSPDQSDTINMPVQRLTDGQYSVKVGDLTQTFTVLSPVFDPSSFIIENIEIIPPNIRVGELITVFVSIFNTGDLEGTDEIELKIDSVTVETQSITINPRERLTLIFEPELTYLGGTYTVSVNGISQQLVITEDSRSIPWLTVLALIVVISGFALYSLRERGIINF
jgi:hypothetical protein